MHMASGIMLMDRVVFAKKIPQLHLHSNNEKTTGEI